MSERNVHSLLAEAASKYRSSPALYEPIVEKNDQKKERSYRSISWVEYQRAVEEISAGLYGLGVRRGDIVALDAETSLGFYLADLGAMCAGAIAAALYTSYPPIEHVNTLRRLEPKVVFAESPRMRAALLSAADPALDVQWVLLTGEGEGALTLESLRASGRAAMSADPGLIGRIVSEIHSGDPAILYLTSGATGEPKMGLVNHGSLVANVDMGPKAVDLGPSDRSIAFLPSAHITQRVAMELLPIRVGLPVWFSEGLTRLPGELKVVKPTFFVAPPRVWERMYSSICTEIKKRGAVTQRIFWAALGIGAEINRRRQSGRPVPGWMQRLWNLADKSIFVKIRERLGGELRLAISGAAPLGKDLADFYAAIGMPIHEGYGLTEGGIVALNPQGRVKPGSIGKPLAGVEMKLTDEGELIFRSPSVFAGYYKDEAATNSILRDGWLYTGDVAEFDDDGYIYITGRKKEVIVSSNGKKIYPAMIESLFKVEPLIHQVLLVGDRLPYVAALFTLNRAIIDTLSGMEAHKEKPVAEVLSLAVVQSELKKIISKINKQLAPFEQIRKFHVLENDFTIEAGELTPTMKVRRSRVLENHRAAVASLYGNREDALGDG
jgi:long-chain acyl-CoA synthetase